ncbi:PDZ domain-containing protein [Microtetraspora malaysiensis]|uniref:PDZ domain-containing protein n=1 Tax=Microtetraspora malaysiensis TaxID=161358 RepID=UPI003D8B01DD
MRTRRPGRRGGQPQEHQPPGGGVRVISVDPGSKADASGLQPGDLITDIAGTPTPTVNDLDTFLDQKRAGTTYPVTVKRGDRRRLSGISGPRQRVTPPSTP